MDAVIVDPEPAAAPEQAEAAAPQGAAPMRGKRKVLTALRNVDNSDAAAAKKTKQKTETKTNTRTPDNQQNTNNYKKQTETKQP